jgi:hypothetical protein
VPPGFEVELFVSNLRDPRVVLVAPNGDIFIAEAEPGRIRVLRATDGAATPSSNDVFASGLDQPLKLAPRNESEAFLCQDADHIHLRMVCCTRRTFLGGLASLGAGALFADQSASAEAALDKPR